MAIAEVEYGLFLKDSDKLWSAYRAILKGRLHVFDFRLIEGLDWEDWSN